MNFIKLIIAIITGLLAITLITESIELLMVMLASGMSFKQLQVDQAAYFATRNTIWILVLKIFYTFGAGIIGGYLTTWINMRKPQIAVYSLIAIQVVALVWGGFISELSSTGPTWMWFSLIVIIPIGIWIGHRMKIKKATNSIHLI